MIDIHCHILPGVDDGARNMKESLKMAQIAVDNGITHICATPHHSHYTQMHRTEVIRRVAALQAEIDKAYIPLTILPGHEVRITPGVIKDWEAGMATYLGESRFVLAEPQFHEYADYTEAFLFELLDRGYTPIIAHPERISTLQRDLSRLDKALERGCLTQVNATSLTGYHGRGSKQTALTLLEQGKVDIIASDSHGTGTRAPRFGPALEVAAEVVGQAAAKAMVTTTPFQILN